MDQNQQLDHLKQKYQSAFRTIEQQGVSLSHVHIRDGKLFIQGAAPSEEAKNRVWDQIKQIDPNWESELVCDLRTEATQHAPNTGQTSVQTAHERE